MQCSDVAGMVALPAPGAMDEDCARLEAGLDKDVGRGDRAYDRAVLLISDIDREVSERFWVRGREARRVQDMRDAKLFDF